MFGAIALRVLWQTGDKDKNNFKENKTLRSSDETTNIQLQKMDEKNYEKKNPKLTKFKFRP